MLIGWAGEEQRVGLTLYTDVCILRGTKVTRQKRLSDIVNIADEDLLVLTDVTIEEFGGRGRAKSAPFAQVNLSAILFAVADATVEAVPELRTPKVPENAFISIPPFEVTGRIHILAERDLREALQELTGRFLPVTDATYGSALLGEPQRQAPMVAVNRARAQILSPFGEALSTRNAASTTAPAEGVQAEADPASPGGFNPFGLTAQNLERKDVEPPA
jgi:hypothetical protein